MNVTEALQRVSGIQVGRDDPGLAPHLSNRLLTQPGLRVETTIDARIQRLAIRALRRQLQGLGGTRARDGAVIVADNATGEILAWVGGIGGASTAPSVDGANSYRQAGSTLKPFLYALGLEKGYLTPASIDQLEPCLHIGKRLFIVPCELVAGFIVIEVDFHVR